MKKSLVVLIAATIAGSVIASPVTYSFLAGNSLSAAPSLYENFNAGVYSTPLANGFYAELIIKQDSSYADGEAGWTVLGNYSQGGAYNLSSLAIGTGSGGTAVGVGEVGFKWQTSTYDTSYYVGIRFYNNADKSKATAYGVTDLKALTVTPAGTSAQSATIAWTTSTLNNNNKFYTSIPISVPEPTTMALFGLGGLALVIRRRIRKEV